jgi:hypothetical protein
MLKFKGCRHVMPAGRRCHSPALRNMAYCFNHQKLHKALNRSKHSHNRVEIASIETPEGVRLAITQVCDALGKARIDEKRAGVMMHGLQLATQLVRKSPKPDPSHLVQDACLDAHDFVTAASHHSTRAELTAPLTSCREHQPQLGSLPPNKLGGHEAL